MRVGKALHIVRIIGASLFTVILFNLVSVMITLGMYNVYNIQLDSSMPDSVASGIVIMIHVFYYSLLLVIVFVLWRFFALPKNLGVVRKIRSMKDFYAPYFPSYYEDDDDDD